MSRQLTFDLALRPALGREDFFVSPSNSAAVALVDQWPQWPSYGAIIVGPEGSGKTHLASVWQQSSGANLKSAAALNRNTLPLELTSNALVLEDIDQHAIDEAAIFHALNLAKQSNSFVLLTARKLPPQWAIQLPDLRSRILSLPVTAISSPDDELLRSVLIKHFADRQISVGEDVINYIFRRMPRTLQAVGQLVAELDSKALEQSVEMTRPFVARVLEQYLAPEFPED